MDALSALKMFAGSDLIAKLNDLAQQASAKSISAPELDKLTPGIESQSLTTTATGSSSSFENLLGNFVGEVNAKQNEATDAITGLMSGKNVSLHQAMISMEEANVSFQMMVEVRNRLLDSYQELMRMQV